MHSNYGEICVKIKDLMEDFQKRSQSTTKVETIAEMKVNKRLIFRIKSKLIQHLTKF